MGRFAAVGLGIVGMLFCTDARAQGAVGDVYVNAEAGAVILVDGAPTGILAPGLVQGVAAGAHTISAERGCRTGTVDVAVRPNAVERAEVAMKPGVGTVMVSTVPYGASVSEDGKVLGTGPLLLTLTCGEHTLALTAEGRLATSHTVNVPLRGALEVTVELPATAIGAVAVTVTPFEAELRVDGEKKGTGPMTIEGLAAGEHTVLATAPGYLPIEQKVTVAAGQIAKLSATLQPAPPPVPVAKKMGLDRVDWARVGVNSGVTLASLGAGAVGWLQYQHAVDAYPTYQGLTYRDQPDAFYADEIEGPRTRAYVLAATSGVGLVASGWLWATTKPRAVTVVPAPGGAAVGGTF